MLWNLLWKDLLRARRNPWPYVINLALPLCITAIIGLVFGGASKEGNLGRIKIAIVDHDDSVFSNFLRGGMNQGEASKYIQVQFVDETEGLKLLNKNKISALMIIPKGFTVDYLKGVGPLSLDLIKNPAQSFYPAIVEEFLQVAVTGLNAVSRNFQSELPDWKQVLEKKGMPDIKRISDLLIRVGNRFQNADRYLFPPLVQYTKITPSKADGKRTIGNVFGFVLPGLAAMFLLFLADHSIRDLYREVSGRTLDRFRTLRSDLLVFIVSKVVLAMAVIAAGSIVIFGGGSWIFGIRWNNVFALIIIIFGFGFFGAGFMAFLAALARSERRANAMNNVVVMCFSFVGGSFFPASDLPPLFRDYLSPLMPNYWFIEALRALQGHGQTPWTGATLKLLLFGSVLVAAAAWMFQRALTQGKRV
jgi:ABC-type multidrug transport system permease subunit